MPDTPSVTAPGDNRRSSRRRARFSARETLWAESSLKRVRHCGRYAAGDHVAIKASGTGADRSAGFGGVQTCGSVWACPVCSEKINAERHREIAAGLDSWRARGGGVLFGTLTLRHNKGHRLADLWDAIGACWNRTTSGAGAAWNGGKPRKDGTRWVGDKERFGIAGYLRIVETKHGANGWHPHVHFILFTDDELTTGEVSDLESRLFGRWEAALAERGFSVLESVGVDLRPVTDASYIAEYLTKHGYAPRATSSAGAAYEVTGSHSKRAGKGGVTPFQLLTDVVELGDADALDLWHEWEQASRGRRQLTWSRGLRDLLGLNVEKSDEDVADEDHGGDTIVSIPAAGYRALVKRGCAVDALEAAEHDTTGQTLMRLLARLGIEHHRPRRDDPGGSLFAA